MRIYILLYALCFFGCAGDLPPPPVALSKPFVERQGTLRLAGTGAMVPLAKRLSTWWGETGGQPQIVVEEGMGSGGGIRAAYDGAIDLGMVSRAWTDDEARLGLGRVVVGQDVVGFAAHPLVPLAGFSSRELPALFEGERRMLPDGNWLVPLLRDRAESAHAALDGVAPGLQNAREEAYRQKRWRVLYSDSAMAQALASTPGSVGVFSMSFLVAEQLPLKMMRIDGIFPTVETILAGGVAPTRELCFVFRKDRRARVEPFLRFITDANIQKRFASIGYVPRSEPAP